MLKRFFGWLFMTQGYLDTLTDDELLIRACSSKREAYAAGFRARQIQENMRKLNELCDRLHIQAMSFPFQGPHSVVYEPPPFVPTKTEAQKREEGRAFDVKYEINPHPNG
jgi:hypothetical protein